MNDGFDEAVRYYRNAEELLARCKSEGKRYKDLKPVREAFGTAWNVDYSLVLKSHNSTLTPSPSILDSLRGTI